MPKYQGELDGLCGPYAIANALEHCGFACFEAAFKESCGALANNRWPKTIWEGTWFGDIKKMLSQCKSSLPELDSLDVRYPFFRSSAVPSSNENYWRKFDELLPVSSINRCAIIGTTRPKYHWIVAYPSGQRVEFVDCTPDKPFVRKDRKSLFAGERNGTPNVWLLERAELIILEKRA